LTPPPTPPLSPLSLHDALPIFSASVVEDSFAAKAGGQRQPDLEAAAMTPRDEAISAEDLLRRIVAAFDQNFFSRASHVPRIVIQNERRMRRTSSRKERRRMYRRSNLNFCRRETSRGA